MTYIWSSVSVNVQVLRSSCVLSVKLIVQECGDSHGGSGPAADGVSLSEHQTLRGEFPAHGGQAAGV